MTTAPVIETVKLDTNDDLHHYVCCKVPPLPTTTLCGAVVDELDGREPNCVVCLDLEPTLLCPLGGQCTEVDG